MAGNRQHIIHGLRDGIPIAMGYFAVTFSLGIIAARAGLISTLFWASGCAVGIVAGSLLPQPMVTALSMSLYGMFLAIIIPPAHKDRNVLYALIASFVLSGLCAVAPVIGEWSSGMRTVMLTIVISAVAAWLKPIKTEPMEQREPSSSLEWPSRDRGQQS